MSATTASRPQALIVLSSARGLPLSEPTNHPGISTGFFLVELAAVIAAFEKDYDFILATPDGQPPQLDVNGLGLNFHAGSSLLATARATVQSAGKRLTPETFRAKNPKLVARRNAELELARRQLGRIPVSQPLPKTDKEVISIRDEVVSSLEDSPPRTYHSIQHLIEQHRDPAAGFSFDDLAFVHMPGGHGPMVDFNDNPWMGELLHSLREAGVLISLICHAPVALTSARYRVDPDGLTTTNPAHAFRGAHITTFPRITERMVLEVLYPKVPGERTRLPYYTDVALKEAGYNVSLGFNPSAARIVWDDEHGLLTGNGPQAIDKQAARLAELVLSRASLPSRVRG